MKSVGIFIPETAYELAECAYCREELSEMNEKFRKISLLCMTGCVMLSGRQLMPLLESVRIGGAVCPAAAVSADAKPAPAQTTALRETEAAVTAAETGTVTQPVVQASADPPPAENALIINRESEGSKAMWHARLFQETQNGSGGEIVDRHFGLQSGDPFFSLPGGGQVRNTTFWSNADLLAESQTAPQLPLKLDGTPIVLIYHTHTTESYVFPKTGNYDEGCSFRTTEPDKNMVAVGDVIAEQLAASGIGVVHARELHDFPVWNGSYGNSAETIRGILAEYPDICIALDIHRDAIADGSTVVAPVAEINGKQSAQIMIISGCDDGTMDMPDYRENFHFACRLQQTAEQMFSGLTRPILFDYRKYNQDMTKGSLLIEVGSQGNTLDEAKYAGELVGKALSETIRQLAEKSGGE